MWAPVVPERRSVAVLESGGLYQGVVSRLAKLSLFGSSGLSVSRSRCHALLCPAAQLRETQWVGLGELPGPFQCAHPANLYKRILFERTFRNKPKQTTAWNSIARE